MSVEDNEDVHISTGESPSVAENTQNGGDPSGQVNGVSNGHSSSKHKSSSKDKYRDKDRDHKSSKSSSSRDKSSSDKKHSSSSSSKDKHRDKDRDKDKDKERDKHRDKDRSDKHKSSSSSHKSSNRDKDKEREKDRPRDKTKEKSRDDKEREKNGEKDKDRERNGNDHRGEKDKDRRKDHKSSSSSKSRSDRDHSDKDRSDRHKSSSSGSKSKHSSSSSSSKNRDKSHHSSRTGAEHSNRDDNSHAQNNGEMIKPDPPNNDYNESCTGFDNSVVKEEPIMQKSEEVFNMSQASSCDYSMTQFKKDEPPFDIKEEASDNETSGNNQNEMDVDEDPLNITNHQSNAMIKKEEEDDEDDEDDDVPLIKRKSTVVDMDDSDEDMPLLQKKKQKVSKKEKEKEKKADKKKEKKVKREIKEEEDDHDEKPLKKKIKKEPTVTETSPTKKRGKAGVKQEEPEVWRWWEEEKRADGVKWNTLEHKGPVFAPPYEPLPKNVKFYYDGKEMKLTTDTEEAATFYAKMLNHDYVTKKQFNENFFKDFRKTMTSKERDIIKDLKKCNFTEMHNFFNAESEKRKNASKEEKAARKLENEEQIKEFGFCIIDGHKERIGNFRLEPPGLFRGRGEHPKMGMIKRRIVAEDVSINCSKESKIPVPPPGHKWKDVRHDNSVTWLASWTENVQGQVKYIMLNPSSKLKGEKDHVKYETARRLDKVIDKIRSTYRDEWKSKEMRVRQRAVALYFIDKLALRAGNEKDEDQADTVGCCSLRVEHVSLHKQLNGKENVVVFDFLGKDSIRYYNEVEVEKRVFKNLELFMENKKEGDDLFDRLNTQVLNEHLKELMDGLTAKVFRTYNASITLQNQLDLLTDSSASIPEKLLAYNRANRAVAILCNHQRSVPKSHAKSMETLKEKIRLKREQLEEAEAEYPDLKKAAKRGSVREKVLADKKLKQIERLQEQLKKLELQETDRDENKSIALGTSKLNYLDPRISVAWCKKNGVPIEKIFNKTQREKFNWAIHMADENYRF